MWQELALYWELQILTVHGITVLSLQWSTTWFNQHWQCCSDSCWIDIPGIDSGCLTLTRLWVQVLGVWVPGVGPHSTGGLSVNLGLLKILGVWHVAILEISALLYKSHRRPGGKNLRGDSAGRGQPASSGTVETRGSWEKRSKSFNRKGWRTGRCRGGGDEILQTNRGHGIQQQTTSEVVTN